MRPYMQRAPRSWTLRERVVYRLVADGDCLVWPGARTAAGYGTVCYRGRTHLTHRVVYEADRGPIPEGHHIDHLCRNPACANPRHLEAVTPAENVRRGESGAWQRAKTHCPRGHAYTPENTYSRPGRRERACRTCRAGARR